MVERSKLLAGIGREGLLKIMESYTATDRQNTDRRSREDNKQMSLCVERVSLLTFLESVR